MPISFDFLGPFMGPVLNLCLVVAFSVVCGAHLCFGEHILKYLGKEKDQACGKGLLGKRNCTAQGGEICLRGK